MYFDVLIAYHVFKILASIS